MNLQDRPPVPVQVAPGSAPVPVEVQREAAPTATVVPLPDNTLVDGTFVVLILTGIANLVKMAFGPVSSMITANNEARIRAEDGAREAEQQADRDTLTTMQNLIDTYSKESMRTNSVMTDALITRIVTSLDSITAAIATLNDQAKRLAETQQRTMHILMLIERDMGIAVPPPPPPSTPSPQPQSPA